MVLFIEDEIEMKEQAKKKRGPVRIWIGRLIKISIFLGILLFLSLTVLSNLGGQSSSLKRGFEDFASRALGYKFEIGAFNYMGFFPEARIDAGNVVISLGEGKVATISEMQIAVGFWKLAFQTLEFNTLRLSNVSVPAGFIGPHPLTIRFLGFELDEPADKVQDIEGAPQLVGEEGNDAAQDQVENQTENADSNAPHDLNPRFIVDARYGEQPFHLEMAVDVEALSRGRKRYSFPEEETFEFRFGEFKASGTYSRQRGGFTFAFKDAGIGEDLIDGQIHPYKGGKYAGVKGSLVSNETKMDFEVEARNFETDAKIHFPVLDFKDLSAPLAIYDAFSSYLTKSPAAENEDVAAPISLPEQPFTLDLKIDELRENGVPLGHIHMPIVIKDQTLKVETVTGEIADGKLSADFVLKTKPHEGDEKDLWVLVSDGKWMHWNYALLQHAFHGFETGDAKADLSWSLNGQGHTWPELIASLKGQAGLIAGNGKLPSKALNIWGAGLFNALLPSLDPDSESDLNCVIADFKIEDGIAKPEALFLDTKRVTVIGDGEIDLSQNKLDLKLSPETKDPALFDVAPSVNVRGNILKPQVSVSTTSIIGKIGGLALGTVNPAFLLLTMTDIGGDNHPCREFVDMPDIKDKSSEAQDNGEEQPRDLNK